jgi:hypothetical protein
MEITSRHAILLDLIRRQEQFKLRRLRPLDPKVTQYIEEGKPFVAVTDDGVLCLLCGKHLKQASTHCCTRHGLPGYHGMRQSERLALYGLTAGQRLASLAYLGDAHAREVAKTGLLGVYRFPLGIKWAAKGKRVPLPCSDKQLQHSQNVGAATLRQEAKNRHRDAAIQRNCSVCGKGFPCRRGDRRMTCDEVCRSRGISLALIRHYQNDTRAFRKGETVCACSFCGKPFPRKRLLRPGAKTFCSSKCRGNAGSHRVIEFNRQSSREQRVEVMGERADGRNDH